MIRDKFYRIRNENFDYHLDLDHFHFFSDSSVEGIYYFGSHKIRYGNVENCLDEWILFTLLKIALVSKNPLMEFNWLFRSEYMRQMDRLFETLVDEKKSSEIIKIDKTNRNALKSFAEIKNGDNILIKHTGGELGDKLTGLVLISKIKKFFPKSKIGVYLWSERYREEDGYVQLYQNYADKVYTREEDIKEHYDYTGEISAYSTHEEEIKDANSQAVYITRYQRWAFQLGFQFTDMPLVNLKFKKSYMIKIDKELGNLKRPIIGFNPFSSNVSKDLEQRMDGKSYKWQSVINRLSDKGCSCVVFDYKPLKFDNCLNLDNLNLVELGYAISKLDLLVGIEAGLTHYAGILGVPLIVLAGLSNPLILKHYRKKRILRKTDCFPCHFVLGNTKEPPRCGSSLKKNHLYECITSITPAEIYNCIKNFKGKDFEREYYRLS